MKKTKLCLAVAILSLSVLSGCGRVRDGYIEDSPAQTIAPIETPAVTKTPKPTPTPDEGGMTQIDPAKETQMPTETPNM